MQQVPSPPGPAHPGGVKVARWRRDKAVHRGHLPLSGDRQAKGGQANGSRRPLAVKTYNDHFIRLFPDMSEDDDFEEEFDEDDDDEFGDDDEGEE